MKNKIRESLNRELQGVHVSESLRERILTAAQDEHGRQAHRENPLRPLAMIAALLVVACASVGIFSLRTPHPDRRDQTYAQGGCDWAWVSPSDQLYHAHQHCGGLDDTVRMTLEEARAEGRTACRVCIPIQSTPRPETDAPDPATASPAPTELPSPTTAPAATEAPMLASTALPTVEATESVELPMPTEAALEDVIFLEDTDGAEMPEVEDLLQVSQNTSFASWTGWVWVSDNSPSFHADRFCSGMKDAHEETVLNALSLSRSPCPVCTNELYLWATKGGTYLHTASNCSGMENAMQFTIEEALALGKGFCPICIGSQNVCSSREEGLYHAISDCPGTRDVKQISLREAEAEEKLPCPVCTSLLDATEWYRQINEGELTLRAVSCGPTLRLEMACDSEFQWIPCDSPEPVDLSSGMLHDLLASLVPYCLTQRQADAFLEAVLSGEARGFRCLEYELSIDEADKQGVVPDQFFHAESDALHTVLLAEDLDDADIPETVQARIRAYSVACLVLPDGNYSITVEPLSLTLSAQTQQEEGVLVADVERVPTYFAQHSSIQVPVSPVEGEQLVILDGDVRVLLMELDGERYLTADVPDCGDISENHRRVLEIRDSLRVWGDTSRGDIAYTISQNDVSGLELTHIAMRLETDAPLEALCVGFSMDGTAYGATGRSPRLGEAISKTSSAMEASDR